MDNGLCSITFSLVSVCPMLQHNGQTADPFNHYAIAIRKFSAKGTKNRTEDETRQMQRIEWEAGLYLSPEGKPVIPADTVVAALQRSSRTDKLGQKFAAGVFCFEDSEIEYDGPKSLDAMWESGKFKDARGVVVSRKRIIRIRPRFNNWRADVVVHFNSMVVNESAVREAMVRAGRFVGFGDKRPAFGRFEVE